MRKTANTNSAIMAERVDTIWGTSRTHATTLAGQVCIFVVLDHCSTELVGHHAALKETAGDALQAVRNAVAKYKGGLEADVAEGLVLRHDNHSNDIADEFQRGIAFLGFESYRAPARKPQGSGLAKRFIRTLKEQLLDIETFADLEDLRLKLDKFADLYNEKWLVQKHNYMTPNQIRAEQKALDKGDPSP